MVFDAVRNYDQREFVVWFIQHAYLYLASILVTKFLGNMVGFPSHRGQPFHVSLLPWNLLLLISYFNGFRIHWSCLLSTLLTDII